MPAFAVCYKPLFYFLSMYGRTPFLYRFQDTKAIMLAAAKIYILKQFTTEELHYHGTVGLYGSVEAQMVNGESAAFFFYRFAMSGIFRTFARISE
ncbi:hypothetical protein [Prevotella denticola]|uniref:hypothetical protein n=1 Tax=Prevotella denticola TaxID=28129 RepID=UPI001BAE275C|nr:hypothetical protein [Prevotella denticola]QUB91586.1 hypothetical protein J4855_03790 [Prevotella denticola]